LQHAEITLVAAVVGAALACASRPENRHHDDLPPPPPAAKPPESTQAKRSAKVAKSPEAVAARLGVDPAQLTWSPGRTSCATELSLKSTANNTSLHRLAIFSAEGEQRAEVAAARPGAIEDLRFLGESRLLYRVAPPTPSQSGKKRTPALPAVVYVIQPFSPTAAPMVYEGRGFAFSSKGEHVAWVSGSPGREWLGADGAQVYPRAGVTRIQGDPAWSSDGRSLAIIEGGARPKLVVLVEFDNPHGDNVWPLPPEATDPTMRVFWAGSGRLVVGHEITKPVFATSFRRQ
jgi:hypothetical protein